MTSKLQGSMKWAWLKHRHVVLTVPLILGCIVVLPGCEQAEVKFEPRDLEGKVDTTLPKPLQAKQEVVARWLRGMQQGIGELAGLRLLVPGVDMKESFDEFYNQHKRWCVGNSGRSLRATTYP